MFFDSDKKNIRIQPRRLEYVMYRASPGEGGAHA